MKLMRREKFSLQTKQVLKKRHSIVHKINADLDQFYDSLISCNKVYCRNLFIWRSSIIEADL